MAFSQKVRSGVIYATHVVGALIFRGDVKRLIILRISSPVQVTVPRNQSHVTIATNQRTFETMSPDAQP